MKDFRSKIQKLFRAKNPGIHVRNEANFPARKREPRPCGRGNLFQKQKGFTLVEILLYLGLLSIFLLVATDFFVTTATFTVESQTTNFVDLDSRLIFSRLRYDLLRADSVSIPAAPGQTSPSLSLFINGQNFSYSLVGDSLTLQEPTGTFALHSNQTKVTSLIFQRIGNPTGLPTIKFTFTIESARQDNGGSKQKTVTSTVSLR